MYAIGDYLTKRSDTAEITDVLFSLETLKRLRSTNERCSFPLKHLVDLQLQIDFEISARVSDG